MHAAQKLQKEVARVQVWLALFLHPLVLLPLRLLLLLQHPTVPLLEMVVAEAVGLRLVGTKEEPVEIQVVLRNPTLLLEATNVFVRMLHPKPWAVRPAMLHLLLHLLLHLPLLLLLLLPYVSRSVILPLRLPLHLHPHLHLLLVLHLHLYFHLVG